MVLDGMIGFEGRQTERAGTSRRVVSQF